MTLTDNALDIGYISGKEQQKRLYFYEAIIASGAVFPERNNLVNEDVEKIYYRLVNEGRISIGATGVNILRFGAVPNNDSINDTDAINAAIDFGDEIGESVFAPGGNYIWDGYRNTRQASVISIEGNPANIPHFRASQEAVNVSHYMFFQSTTRYSTVPGLSLATNIKPNQQTINLTSVAGLSAGMMIQISSNKLWYNGHRDAYYCGEIHKITFVSTTNSTVTVEDYTRDQYSKDTNTLVIRAWNPNRVSLKNLHISAPYPQSLVTSVGLALQQCVDVIVDNVKLDGFRSSMILDNLNWNSRFTNIKFNNDDNLDTSIGSGYGIECNGSVGTLVDGLYSKGLRRAWDAGSISGITEAAVARDWKVTNFIVRGGGAWFPNTGATGYGIGMHGSSEGGVISNGFMQDCSNGITARGRNTTVYNVEFSGTFDSCISLHENGAGLTVRNCTYDSYDFPNKFNDLSFVESGSGARTFLQLGLQSGGVDANCFYDLPIIVENNSAKGVTQSFIQFSQNTLVAKNFRCTNNTVMGRPGTGNIFHTFYSPIATTNLTGSIFDSNNDEVVDGTCVTWSTNLVLAYKDPSTSTLEFKIDGTYYARIPNDTVIRIPRAVRAGQRNLMIGHADAGGSCFVRLIAENVGFTSQGAASSAGWGATNLGSSMTGTTNSVGQLTFGLMLNGDLYVENRLGALYTLRLNFPA